MPHPTPSEVRSFDSTPVCSITPDALIFAGREIPFANLQGFGISSFRDPLTSVESPCLQLAFRDERGRRRVFATVLPMADHPLVHALRERLPGAWVGAGSHMEVRKRLGFSNRLIIAIYVAIALLVVGLTVGIIIGVLR